MATGAARVTCFVDARLRVGNGTCSHQTFLRRVAVAARRGEYVGQRCENTQATSSARSRPDEATEYSSGREREAISYQQVGAKEARRGAARPRLTIMPGARLPTVQQVSAGGVVYRRAGDGEKIAVALVRVGPKRRWQLPKGIVDEGESPPQTAVREVREEAGVDAEIVALLDEIEYWYVGTDAHAQRVRFHKRVHFFLLEYRGGDVADHDREVDEARWLELGEAEAMLAFESERKVMAHASRLLTPSSFGIR